MSTKIKDVLTVNFTLHGVELLRNQESFNDFRDSVDSEILLVETPHGGRSGRRHELPKHRISLYFASDRSTIAREYPSRCDLSMLAMVANNAISYTNLDEQKSLISAYIALVYYQDSGLTAAEYLSKRILKDGFIGDEWALIGGSAKMSFHNAGTHRKVTIEPRFNDPVTDKVFLNLELIRDAQQIPDGRNIQISLEETWDEATKFLNHLDESGV